MTDLEVFICSFLPFLVHGVWCGLGEQASGGEDGQAGEDAEKDTESNLVGLVCGGLSARAVRTKSNPVCCEIF